MAWTHGNNSNKALYFLYDIYSNVLLRPPRNKELREVINQLYNIDNLSKKDIKNLTSNHQILVDAINDYFKADKGQELPF